MVGLDLHSEPGIIKVNQKLTKESGSNVDDLVKVIVPCSNGSSYLFGSTNGKIWERQSNGTYTLRHTASPGAGSIGIKGAFEDQGYLYWVTQSRIGRVAVPSAGGAFSGQNDDWATLTNGDASYHPTVKLNLVNYIGDGKYISQIEDGVFTADALDLKEGTRVKSLGAIITELLAGTFIATDVNNTNIYRWNTWSESFSSDDPVPENGINAFIPTDNYVLVQAGNKGNFYIYSNDRLERAFKIPGSWGGTNKAIVHPNAGANYNGLPLFGLSNVNGNPAPQGVYSYGSYSPNYPAILNLEYVISQNKTSSIEIGAIAVVGDLILVSWKDGSSYGVDKLDTSAKYTGAYLDTRLIMKNRIKLARVATITVAYRTLPSGTSINIKNSKNHGSFSSAMTTKQDTKRKTIYTTVALEEVSTLQVRVEPVANGNDAPEIEQITIDL